MAREHAAARLAGARPCETAGAGFMAGCPLDPKPTKASVASPRGSASGGNPRGLRVVSMYRLLVAGNLEI